MGGDIYIKANDQWIKQMDGLELETQGVEPYPLVTDYAVKSASLVTVGIDSTFRQQYPLKRLNDCVTYNNKIYFFTPDDPVANATYQYTSWSLDLNTKQIQAPLGDLTVMGAYICSIVTSNRPGNEGAMFILTYNPSNFTFNVYRSPFSSGGYTLIRSVVAPVGGLGGRDIKPGGFINKDSDALNPFSFFYFNRNSNPGYEQYICNIATGVVDNKPAILSFEPGTIYSYKQNERIENTTIGRYPLKTSWWIGQFDGPSDEQYYIYSNANYTTNDIYIPSITTGDLLLTADRCFATNGATGETVMYDGTRNYLLAITSGTNTINRIGQPNCDISTPPTIAPPPGVIMNSIATRGWSPVFVNNGIIYLLCMGGTTPGVLINGVDPGNSHYVVELEPRINND